MDTFESFSMVYVEGGHSPTMKHGNYENAKQEAERLARLPDNQGKKVYVLTTSSCCVYNPVKWLSPVEQPVPF